MHFSHALKASTWAPLITAVFQTISAPSLAVDSPCVPLDEPQTIEATAGYAQSENCRIAAAERKRYLYDSRANTVIFTHMAAQARQEIPMGPDTTPPQAQFVLHLL